ncbi:MAG: Rpn family recombination-promoting nuclease/putative transposase [Planctomycetaceae bacterium]|jgi:predicted transposase/invertase (TIGR01784 family)|nr:Rpn family recombination-promoting nuclease/putative transposase [Planctomycetaceae bacterium]
MKYLDPKIDPVFKRVFGEHKNLCRSLLNSILPLPPSQQIVDLSYKPTELLPEIPCVSKNSIVDVNCIDNMGRQFIVEMQIHWLDTFKSRVLFNASKAYIKQLDVGKDYSFLKPVYAVNFVNDIFDPDPSVFYHDYKIVNIADINKQIEGLELVFIELPKFRPSNNKEKKLRDLWLRFLTEIKESQPIPDELLNEEITREAIQLLQVTSYTDAALNTYEHYCDEVRTFRTLILGNQRKGKEEGLKEGKEEGLKEGLKEGKEKNLIDIVLKCHSKGYSMEQIQDITDLNEKRILEIIESVGENSNKQINK